MWMLIAILALISALWICAFYQSKPSIWIGCIGLFLICSTILNFFPPWLLIPCWTVFGIITIFAAFSQLRIFLISKFLFRWFCRQQSFLSKAEKQALEAGDTWWEKELLTGQPDWQKLLNLGSLKLTLAEQDFIDNQVTSLCHLINEWQISHQDYDLSATAWKYLKEQGFWGLEIHQKYGGHGFSPLAHSMIISKIATRSFSAAITIMVPNSLGPASFIEQFGTQQQKDYYLPRLAKGEEIPCFALTGPEAGSDAMHIPDKGVVCYGEYLGKKIIGIRLNWQKRYITLAPIATLIGLAFKLEDPEHLLGDEKEIGITLALIPANYPGVVLGNRHLPMNLAFMNGPISGEDVFIPCDWIIGGVEQRGKGWQMMMECLAIGRSISLPSLSCAFAQSCFCSTSAYAVIRRQFHRSLGQFEGIQEVLARIGGFTYICEAARLLTVHAQQLGHHPIIASALSKYHLTELSRQIVIDAMDIHAGRGIQTGNNNYLADLYQATAINVTVEGANILTRNLIIFGQGVVRCHPYLYQELLCAADPTQKESLLKFDKLLFAHIGFFISRIARLFIYSFTNGCWIKTPVKNPAKTYYRQLTRISNLLIVLTDLSLLILGKKLKFKESLSARLGDIFSYLYLSSAVLKYYHDNNQAQSEQIFMQWSMNYCVQQIDLAIHFFLKNFPIRWLGKYLRFCLFPWGRLTSLPEVQLNREVSQVMQTNSELRQRLSHSCYLESDSALYIVERAMQSILKAEPLLTRISQHKVIMQKNSLIDQIKTAYDLGLLDEQEWQQLQKVAEYYWQALQVDSFDKNTIATLAKNAANFAQADG